MCDNGLEYSACGPMFQPTCPALRNETYAYLANNITRTEGCYCPEGTVLNGQFQFVCAVYLLDLTAKIYSFKSGCMGPLWLINCGSSCSGGMLGGSMDH
jgi:hypothetical protein